MKFMARSPDNWKMRFEGKTRSQIADKILQNLAGYRKNSLSRASDLDMIDTALIALNVAEKPVPVTAD
jgi:hypothetical protein